MTLEVLNGGTLSTIQDRGRFGLRRFGVPASGALDPQLMRIANCLVGNPEDHAVIESFEGGLQLRALASGLRVAVAGGAHCELLRDGQRSPLPAWRSVRLEAGDHLRVLDTGARRCAVVALAGLEIAPQLGSASTYVRAGLGGIDGRALRAGDRLQASSTASRPARILPKPPKVATGPIRVVPGPQQDHFEAAVMATFLSASYVLSSDADRMGLRLAGPQLVHRRDKGSEIISDTTVPGSIQVPGNGQPIVLLADAQTAGGYPKIATVIGADLGRLAASRPGQVLRFTLVDAAEAERLARATEAETRSLLARLGPLLDGGIDEAALYACNLVSGVVHSLSSEYRPDAAATAPE